LFLREITDWPHRRERRRRAVRAISLSIGPPMTVYVHKSYLGYI
jgi:hypothetical protein